MLANNISKAMQWICKLEMRAVWTCKLFEFGQPHQEKGTGMKSSTLTSRQGRGRDTIAIPNNDQSNARELRNAQKLPTI